MFIMSYLSNFVRPLRSSIKGRICFVVHGNLKQNPSLKTELYQSVSKSAPPPTWLQLSRHFSSIHNFQNTIYALSSGHGKCGVAVIRVSGPNAKEALLKLGNFTETPKPRSAVLRKLIHPVTQVVLDKALVLWFPGPHSFTGEDSCELHVHGGPAVVSGVFEALENIRGLQQAEPGDFTRRAFTHGKLDLPEVEGLADLIHAETEVQRQQALRQMDGDLSRLYTQWRTALIQCTAKVAAYIDFSEDELIEDDVLIEVKIMVEKLKHDIRYHLDDKRCGERLRSGVRLAIIGEPNVGKSSVFNKLCQRPAAIVSPIAGTTRDVVENALNINGYPVVLCDTAGMHEASDPIEVEGVRRAKDKALTSDLQVIVIDASKIIHQPPKNTNSVPLHQYISYLGFTTGKDIDNDGNPSIDMPKKSILSSEEIQIISDEFKQVDRQTEDNEVKNLSENKGEVIVIFNKCDLVESVETRQLLSGYTDCCYLSCVTEEGMGDFLELLTTKVEQLCGNPSSGSPSLTQARHRACLRRCEEALISYLSYHESDSVLAGEQLRRAVYHMGKLTGKITSEDILDVVFRDFCIGK